MEKKHSQAEIAGAFSLLDGCRRRPDSCQADGSRPTDRQTDRQRTEAITAAMKPPTRKPTQYRESALQSRCVAWYRRAYRAYWWSLFHVANEGRRSIRQGARWLALGGVAGVADLVLLAPNGEVSFYELKTESGKQSAAQKQWQQYVEGLGYAYHVIRQLTDFTALVTEAMSAAGARCEVRGYDDIDE